MPLVPKVLASFSSVVSRRTLLPPLVLCACAGLRDPPDPPEAPPVAGVAPTPGAPGIGDPMFPQAGNGGYDVTSYDLAIALEKPDGPIDARATVRARSTQALSRYDLDLHGLEVRAIEVDGAPAAFAREGDELVITPARPIADGADFLTTVRYGGTPEGVVEPSFPFKMKVGWVVEGGEVYVLSEPTGAKSFFPCNDHPRDKALYTIRITVPKPLRAVSNGTLAETLDGGDRRTFVYRPRDPIATYLVTIAIAEFEETDLPGPDGLSIHNYFAPKTTDRARRSFDGTAGIVRFLGDTFGPYPFETCGNILSSLDLPGALETQTLPIFGVDAARESVICHEQAHQWFGDAVSVESWEDIWLNEGFAEYAAWMYIESTRGREAFETHVRGMYAVYRSMEERPQGSGADATAADGPHERGRTAPPGRPTSGSLFGPGVYLRGPLALHALRREVGDAAFLALMRSWVREHRNGNASIADFLRHVERGSSQPARSVVEHWIFDDEMPHVADWDEQIRNGRGGKDG
jgi:aminopeptidase N